jgi:hypothetical protein
LAEPVGYTEKVLGPDEVVLYVARQHWWVYARAIILLVAGAWLFRIGLAAERDDAAGAFEGFFGLFLLLFGIVLLPIIWLGRRSTELVVTNRKVIAKWRVIVRRTIEQELQKIDSLQITQGLIGRALNYGSVFIHGSGSSITPVSSIAQPIEFRNHVQKAIEAVKGHSGAR